MKSFVCIFTLALILMDGINAQARDLNSYQWKNRILLLVGSIPDSEAMQDQLEAFLETPEELADRQLLLFLVNPDKILDKDGKPTDLSPASLYLDYGIAKRFQGLLLIGKDGGLKFKEGFGVAPKIIFNLIDSMPMRRAEMRAKKD